MAVTTYAKEVYKALVVDEKFFRRLAELAQSHGVTPRFKVDVSDDATIEQLTVDELLALPNTRHRSIVNAELQNDYKAPVTIRLRLKGKFSETTCSYEVIGTEKDATYLAMEIDRLIKDASRPFSYFSSMRPSHAGAWWLIITSLPPIFIFTALALGFHDGTAFFAAWASVTVLALTVSFYYGRIIGSIAPPIFFLIGDGIERAASTRRRASMILSLLFVAILLGVAVSISGNWLYERLFKSGAAQ